MEDAQEKEGGEIVVGGIGDGSCQQYDERSPVLCRQDNIDQELGSSTSGLRRLSVRFASGRLRRGWRYDMVAARNISPVSS